MIKFVEQVETSETYQLYAKLVENRFKAVIFIRANQGDSNNRLTIIVRNAICRINKLYDLVGDKMKMEIVVDKFIGENTVCFFVDKLSNYEEYVSNDVWLKYWYNLTREQRFLTLGMKKDYIKRLEKTISQNVRNK